MTVNRRRRAIDRFSACDFRAAGAPVVVFQPRIGLQVVGRHSSGECVRNAARSRVIATPRPRRHAHLHEITRKDGLVRKTTRLDVVLISSVSAG